MSQYQMNINGKIKLADYSSIHDYIAIVNRNDKLTINVDNSAKENFTIIKKILEDNDFKLEQHKEIPNETCCIMAYKK
jgi:hypothetical protein